MSRWRRVATLVCAAAVLSATVQTTPGLTLETSAEVRTRDASGAYVFAPAVALRLGDEIFYTLRARNATPRPIQDATIVRAIPRNTRYVANTAVGPGAAVTFSVDGGKSFAEPDELFMTGVDGTRRRATTADYTHIRWQLRHELPAQATALLRFRAVFR